MVAVSGLPTSVFCGESSATLSVAAGKKGAGSVQTMSTPPATCGAGTHDATAPLATHLRVPVLPPTESLRPTASRPEAHVKAHVP